MSQKDKLKALAARADQDRKQLRMEIATLAMNGYLSGPWRVREPEEVADIAVQTADALIKRLEET